MPWISGNRWVAACALAPLLVLSGCAQLPLDAGVGRVAQLTRERTGQGVAAVRQPEQLAHVRERSQVLLKAPLTVDAAVELAFLNSPVLQVTLSRLDSVQAEHDRAQQLPNPLLGFARLGSGGLWEIERSVTFDVLGLLTWPAVRQQAAWQFDRAQFEAADQAVALAAQVRSAYFQAVASQALLAHQAQAAEAADAARELAQRLAAAGNISQLALLRHQVLHAEGAAQLLRARRQAAVDRERLIRLLGIDEGASAVQLPDHLPPLPAQMAQPREAQQTALRMRLDVLMAQQDVMAAASTLQAERLTRGVDALGLGYQNKSEAATARLNGYVLALRLPLLDAGASGIARAEAKHRQAIYQAAAVATQARSDVREFYGTYQAAYELAMHYRDQVVPLRQRITQEGLLRYNGMLTSSFELLADAREQIASASSAVAALRDFWLADAQLQTALTGRSPGAPALSDAGSGASDAAVPGQDH